MSNDTEVQVADAEDNLWEAWLAAATDLLWMDWVQHQESELDWHDPWFPTFEEWNGSEDWDDRGEEEKSRVRLQGIADLMERERALKEKWKSAETDQSYGDWREEALDEARGEQSGDWSDDFEEWGDDDWDEDDSEDTQTGALNPTPQQNAVRNATALAVQSAQAGATGNAAMQAARAGAHAGAYAAAETARPRASAPRFTLVVGVR